MFTDNKIWLAQSDKRLFLLPNMANRHGLIAGATGTGKTVTMKVMAESFSEMGVPVFLADIKGDLTGMCKPGKDSADMQARIQRFGIEDFSYHGYPTRFWDIFGEVGHPVRVTVSSMGPVLLSRLLGLTEIQSGVLNIVFKVADDNGLLLLDLKDLRAMLQFVGENRAEFTVEYGNVSAASIGAIQRALLAFEQEGGELFFGEPELDITDWMATDVNGRGYINVLSSQKLIQSPTVYATFLLWMLTELFERLPEVGDLDKPKMIFFFDEAHLLFNGMPKALLQKIVQVVKLIRSKAVGVYFISQSPSDIPGDVLAQLSNRVQHALRAYTPDEQKAVRAAARAFRANPAFKTEDAIMELGVGEALVSFLDEEGIPSIVERASILPPQSLMKKRSSASFTGTSWTRSTVRASTVSPRLRSSPAPAPSSRSSAPRPPLPQPRKRPAKRPSAKRRSSASRRKPPPKSSASRKSSPRRRPPRRRSLPPRKRPSVRLPRRKRLPSRL